MKRNFLSYILRMFLFYALIVFLPLEYSMILGAAFFSVTAMAASFGSMALMTVIGVLLFSLFSEDFILGAIMVLSFVIPGWIEGVMLRRKKSLSATLAAATVARGGMLLACYTRMSVLENTTIKELIIGDAPAELAKNFADRGYPEEMSEHLNEIFDFMGNMIPAVIIISALSFAFLTIACTKLFTRRTPFIFAGIRKLSEIKTDISFTSGALLIAVLTFFVNDDYKIIFLNCLYVLWGIYTATGFAFLYRLVKKGLKHRGVSFLISAIVSGFSFGVILPLMGLIGSFFKTDFDKRTETGEKTEEINQNNDYNDEERKED